MDEREMRRVRDQDLFTKKSERAQKPPKKLQNTVPATTTKRFTMPDNIPQNDQYGAWQDPPFVPEHSQKSKKSGAMRWLDPDWSVVRWVKGVFTEEDDMHAAQYHHT